MLYTCLLIVFSGMYVCMYVVYTVCCYKVVNQGRYLMLCLNLSSFKVYIL